MFGLAYLSSLYLFLRNWALTINFLVNFLVNFDSNHFSSPRHFPIMHLLAPSDNLPSRHDPKIEYSLTRTNLWPSNRGFMGCQFRMINSRLPLAFAGPHFFLHLSCCAFATRRGGKLLLVSRKRGASAAKQLAIGKRAVVVGQPTYYSRPRPSPILRLSPLFSYSFALFWLNVVTLGEGLRPPPPAAGLK